MEDLYTPLINLAYETCCGISVRFEPDGSTVLMVSSIKGAKTQKLYRPITTETVMEAAKRLVEKLTPIPWARVDYVQGSYGQINLNNLKARVCDADNITLVDIKGENIL